MTLRRNVRVVNTKREYRVTALRVFDYVLAEEP